MTNTTTRPALTNAETAARQVANVWVREHRITRAVARMVVAFTVAYVPPELARLRLAGQSPQEITALIEARRAAADSPGTQLAADIFAAVWAGMQADLTAYSAAPSTTAA